MYVHIPGGSIMTDSARGPYISPQPLTFYLKVKVKLIDFGSLFSKILPGKEQKKIPTNVFNF